MCYVTFVEFASSLFADSTCHYVMVPGGRGEVNDTRPSCPA